MTSPTWLNDEYIQTVLRNHDNNDAIVVCDLDVSPAVAKGENYASQLHRVVVRFRTGNNVHTRQLIVKSLPLSEMIQKLVVDCGTFERELNMYEVTLPEMNHILNTHELPPLSATSYKTSRERTIIMADLTAEGFKMAERRAGLDLNQSCLVLKTLARFHAVSLVLLNANADNMKIYNDNYYIAKNKDKLISYFEPMFNSILSKVSTWPGFVHFVPKLKTTLTVDNLIAFMEKSNPETIVMNHGDPWVNNMLFQYSDTGDVTSMRFVDYQEMRLTSPALDLQYYLYTSPHENVRKEHWHRLLESYHDEFVATMNKCRLDIPEDLKTVAALETKMVEKAFFGLFATATILPLVIAEPNTSPDFDNWEGEDSVTMFDSERFRSVFQELLHHFEERNVFSSLV